MWRLQYLPINTEISKNGHAKKNKGNVALVQISPVSRPITTKMAVILQISQLKYYISLLAHHVNYKDCLAHQ